MKNIAVIASVLFLLGAGCQYEDAPQKNDDLSFEQRAKCEELGSRYRKEHESGENKWSYFEPVYGYSQKRGTCLYLGGMIEKDSLQEYLIDLLTNEKVAEYMTFKGETILGNREDFALDKIDFKAELQNQFEIKQ